MQQPLVEVKVWGDLGCFTRPEFKVERVSYPLITPSAACGVLEAIYWKPEFQWRVTELCVLPHPDAPNANRAFENYIPITFNEVSDEGDRHPAEYNLNDHRIQRSCLVLRRPCYLIRARADIPANGTTNPQAIKRQFDDRVASGQCFHQPYMGMRQFTAFFSKPDDAAPLPIDGEFGLFVHSVGLAPDRASVRYRFARCTLVRGRWLVGDPEVVH